MSTIMGLRRTLVGVVTTTGLVSSTLLGSPSACADEPPPTQCARGLNEADLDRLDAATDMLTPRDSLPSLRDAQRLATGRGVTVAVIDTGVNRNGDLPTLAPGGDLLGDTDGTEDCDLHGTIVATIIAGHGQARGVAPDARLVSIRQTSAHARPDRRNPQSSSTTGTLTGVAEAIDKMVDAHARVINISVAACTDPQMEPEGIGQLRGSLDHAERAGVSIVAAAGNTTGPCRDGMNAYPAHEPTVISVGAVGGDHHQRAEYALTGGDITAPGGPAMGPQAGSSPIMAATDPEEIRRNPAAHDHPTPHPFVGTSFSSPLVAGTVALMLEVDPHLSPSHVRQILAATATPGAGSHAGMVHPARAVEMARRHAESGGVMPAEPPAETASDITVPTTHTANRPAHRTVLILVALPVTIISAVGITVMIARRRR
ncbi:S8 family serine peptidase [Corynebacterium kroppenstedtii]|uniref:S8 family serine peptidase n=1 Tax=Corynebacterium sp. PCR 32 TaxID=3351342 RepID=UPI0030996181